MGRIKINDEVMSARFALGTFERIDNLLFEKEKRSDFIRTAVEHELSRRERLEAKASTKLDLAD